LVAGALVGVWEMMVVEMTCTELGAGEDRMVINAELRASVTKEESILSAVILVKKVTIVKATS
jgi:hypothetical protein